MYDLHDRDVWLYQQHVYNLSPPSKILSDPGIVLILVPSPQKKKKKVSVHQLHLSTATTLHMSCNAWYIHKGLALFAVEVAFEYYITSKAVLLLPYVDKLTNIKSTPNEMISCRWQYWLMFHLMLIFICSSYWIELHWINDCILNILTSGYNAIISIALVWWFISMRASSDDVLASLQSGVKHKTDMTGQIHPYSIFICHALHPQNCS